MTQTVDAGQRRASATLAVVVQQLRHEADGVVSVRLRAADGGPLPEWAPGAHVDLAFPTGIERQYSLCGPLGERSYYQVAVRRERTSRGGSEYVHMFLRPGQPLSLTGPRNNFGFSRSDSHLFVAGGIGITPILPMIQQAQAWGTDWHLLYGGRTAASMPFIDHLRQYPDRVRLYPSGRIPLAEHLTQVDPDSHVYACGPAGLLSALQDAVSHWPADQVHVERFKPQAHAVTQNQPVEVVCARSAKTISVAAEQSILAALELSGIDMPSSCRSGICGSCEARVLDGVVDHRDDILPTRDRANSDRMFVCVSRAHTPQLTLDV